MRRLFISFVVLAVCNASLAQSPKKSGRRAPAPAAVRGVEYRLLLIIKRRTALTNGAVRCEGSVSEDEIEAVRKQFTQRTPEFVRAATQGMVRLTTEVVVSEEPSTRANYTSEGISAVLSKSVDPELRTFGPGKYDGIFVFWQSRDAASRTVVEAVPVRTEYPWEGTNLTPVTSVSSGGRDWSRPDACEAFIRGWIEQVEVAYHNFNVDMPLILSQKERALGGVTTDRAAWYRTYLAGVMPDGSKGGLGPRIWAFGPPRRWAWAFQPEFLNAERRRGNLLRDGSFEGGRRNAPGWRYQSVRGGILQPDLVAEDVKAGGKAAHVGLRLDDDAAAYTQTVAVQPDSFYLVGGWYKSASVFKEPPGKDPRIAIEGGRDRRLQESTGGEWKEFKYLFYTGDKTSLTLSIGLGVPGYSQGKSKGDAWFDDLVMVRVPPNDGRTAATGRAARGE